MDENAMRPVIRGLIHAANRPAPTPSRQESPFRGLVHSHAESAASPKMAERMKAAKEGKALPDGSFPIRNLDELHKAMGLVGNGKNPTAAKALIRKRAKELGVGLPKGY